MPAATPLSSCLLGLKKDALKGLGSRNACSLYLPPRSTNPLQIGDPPLKLIEDVKQNCLPCACTCIAAYMSHLAFLHATLQYVTTKWYKRVGITSIWLKIRVSRRRQSCFSSLRTILVHKMVAWRCVIFFFRMVSPTRHWSKSHAVSIKHLRQ